MPDVAAQIREQLDAWMAPTRIFEHPEPLTTEQYDDLIARFKAAQGAAAERHELKVIPPSAFDRMRAALLAVLGEHQPMELYYGPDDIGHMCGACRYFTSEWPCPTVAAVAEKLGIGAVDG